MKRIYLYILVYSIACRVFGQQAEAENDSMAISIMRGKPAPEIKVTTIEKKSYTLGKPGDAITVVNFWFIACGPCRKELPILTQLADNYKKQKGVRFLSISNIDTEGSLKYVKKRLDLRFELVV